MFWPIAHRNFESDRSFLLNYEHLNFPCLQMSSTAILNANIEVILSGLRKFTPKIVAVFALFLVGHSAQILTLRLPIPWFCIIEPLPRRKPQEFQTYLSKIYLGLSYDFLFWNLHIRSPGWRRNRDSCALGPLNNKSSHRARDLKQE